MYSHFWRASHQQVYRELARLDQAIPDSTKIVLLGTLGGSYNARWVTLVPAGGQRGEKFRAITFVINHAHPRYMAELSVEQTAALIATGCGELGSCREYLENTMAHLLELGVRDTSLTRIAAALPKP